MSGRGTITRRAVFSSRFSTFSIIMPLVARQVAAGHALGHDVPQLFFGVRQLGVFVWPRPSTQSVRLLALFSSQITGEKTYDKITSGGAVQQHDDLGRPDRQALRRLLAQRHVQERDQRERDQR